MKKVIFAIALSLLSHLAQAQIAYAIRFDVRNSSNSAYISRFAPPNSTEPCMLVMPSINDGGIPYCARLGTAISLANGGVSIPVMPGPQGVQGQQGPIGPQGIQGIQGPVGPSGANGSPGADGAPGVAGIQGETGPQGAAGIQGPAGAIGATGPTGAVGPIGLTGPQGAAGSVGPQGLTGATGPAGATGATGPAGAAAPTFNFGAPVVKVVAIATAYQAADVTKAANISITPSCTNSTTVLAASACTMQVRQSSTAGISCSTGTIVKSWSSTIALGLVITQGNSFPFDIKLPIGGYFILCAQSGTFTISAVEQSAG